MKLLLFSINMVLLFSCNQVRNNNTDVELIVSHKKDSIYIFNDTLVQNIIKYGINNNEFLKINPIIVFKSGEKNSVSFYYYQIQYYSLQLGFLSEHFDVSKRSVSINKKTIKTIRNNTDELNIDSADINIIYTESDFYALKQDSSYLLIRSLPMLMMKGYYFYQLVNLKEKTVIEFIREEE